MLDTHMMNSFVSVHLLQCGWQTDTDIIGPHTQDLVQVVTNNFD